VAVNSEDWMKPLKKTTVHTGLLMSAPICCMRDGATNVPTAEIFRSVLSRPCSPRVRCRTCVLPFSSQSSFEAVLTLRLTRDLRTEARGGLRVLSDI
jgi:hypothetical protein